jgi:thioredoxin 2
MTQGRGFEMSALNSDARGVLVSCAKCGQTNRLRYDALDKHTRCGKCQTILDAANAPVAVSDAAAFDAMVATAALPIVVDFWAPWCGPCRMMAPELDKVARSLAGKWIVAKVDTEALPDLGQRFRIQSIPTLMVFRGGREASRKSGALPAAEILRLIGP